MGSKISVFVVPGAIVPTRTSYPLGSARSAEMKISSACWRPLYTPTDDELRQAPMFETLTITTAFCCLRLRANKSEARTAASN